jgi:hypothetical protein
MKVHYCKFCSLAQNKRPPMKKEATPKRKGLKTKDLESKKRQHQNARGSKQKPFNEKRGNPKRKRLKTKDLR